jgi:hypothetical protein
MLDPFSIPGAMFADEREFTEIASVRREVDIRHLLLVRGRGVRHVDAGRLRRARIRLALPLSGGIDAWRDAGFTVVPVKPATGDCPAR